MWLIHICTQHSCFSPQTLLNHYSFWLTFFFFFKTRLKNPRWPQNCYATKELPILLPPPPMQGLQAWTTMSSLTGCWESKPGLPACWLSTLTAELLPSLLRLTFLAVTYETMWYFCVHFISLRVSSSSILWANNRISLILWLLTLYGVCVYSALPLSTQLLTDTSAGLHLSYYT